MKEIGLVFIKYINGLRVPHAVNNIGKGLIKRIFFQLNKLA